MVSMDQNPTVIITEAVKAPKSYKQVVAEELPKDILFDDKVEVWSEGEIEDGSDDHMPESQYLDLNQNPGDDDPMLPSIYFPPRLRKKLHVQWKYCLIVKLLGKSIGYNTLKTRVKVVWDLEGDFTMVDLDEGFFLFKFLMKEDYHHVLTGGP